MNWLDAVLVVLLVGWVLVARSDRVLNVLPAGFNALRDFFGDGLRTITGQAALAAQPVSMLLTSDD